MTLCNRCDMLFQECRPLKDADCPRGHARRVTPLAIAIEAEPEEDLVARAVTQHLAEQVDAEFMRALAELDREVRPLTQPVRAGAAVVLDHRTEAARIVPIVAADITEVAP